MLLQTDKRLGSTINRWGCNFMVLIAIPQIITSKFLDDKAIVGLYAEAIKKKIVSGNAWINDNNALISLASSLLGVKPLTVKPTGRFARLEYATPFGSHFVLVDGKTSILYNPDPSLTINAVKAMRCFG